MTIFDIRDVKKVYQNSTEEKFPFLIPKIIITIQ